MTVVSAAVSNRLIADAKSLPDLVTTAKTVDPALYTALTGSNDKAVWLAPATSAVAWVASRYALGWDTDACSLIALVGGSIVLGIWHWLSPRLNLPK
jgi:hypothetical protein